MKPFESEELVFCHNDLSNNVIVDPGALKVNAIIDWEYAGFYPEQFEGKFFKGWGLLVAQAVAQVVSPCPLASPGTDV